MGNLALGGFTAPSGTSSIWNQSQSSVTETCYGTLTDRQSRRQSRRLSPAQASEDNPSSSRRSGLRISALGPWWRTLEQQQQTKTCWKGGRKWSRDVIRQARIQPCACWVNPHWFFPDCAFNVCTASSSAPQRHPVEHHGTAGTEFPPHMHV